MGTQAHGNSASLRLVVFGCGYVGQAVVALAQARGWRVTAFTRNASTADRLRAEGNETVVGDLATTAWYDEVPAAPDFVVDCVSAGGRGLTGYQQSYVAGMASLLGWLGTRGSAGTVVYTSSTSVYPNTGGARVDESAPALGRDDRAKLLVEAERALIDGAAGACRRWFVLRLAGIYGPGRHHLLEQVRSGVVCGFGPHRLNLIHRDDVAAAIVACLAAPDHVRDRVFNVADDDPAPKAEVTAWMALRIGMQPPRFSGIPAEGRSAVPLDRVIANDAIKTALGWRPRYASFREGYEPILAADDEQDSPPAG